MRVQVQAGLLSWAQERSGRSAAWVQRRFPRFHAWVDGESQPTLRQLETFAKATYTPVGFFFLSAPPAEKVPIPDFRTMRNQDIERPSPNLLDTVYVCEQRQEWYREFARTIGQEERSFVGSATLKSNVEETATEMRHALGFDLDERRAMPRWEDALRRFIEQADQLGVLVMVSGIVGTNTKRKLNPDEFRGFALADPLAPLVFINGVDTKSAQMFTLAHELAHLWLGQSALSNIDPDAAPMNKVEDWCNRVAAELLVPLAAFREEYQRQASLLDEMQRLARVFKVSTLVVLRRMRDAGGISNEQFWTAYDEEVVRLRKMKASSGGDFYNSQSVRIGKRLAKAVVASTLEGSTLYTEAFRLLGVRNTTTFDAFARKLEVL